MCGEHHIRDDFEETYKGSSPRVRGTPGGEPAVNHQRGIIPACAGNTVAIGCTIRFRRDHPRVCGEHPSSGMRQSLRSGSSPRVRGTLIIKSPVYRHTGIIPACAGNTLENPSSKSRKRKAKLHFNQFAEEMQRCLTVRFCAMGSFVVKVQQVKHGFQTIVWRLW